MPVEEACDEGFESVELVGNMHELLRRAMQSVRERAKARVRDEIRAALDGLQRSVMDL